MCIKFRTYPLYLLGATRPNKVEVFRDNSICCIRRPSWLRLRAALSAAGSSLMLHASLNYLRLALLSPQ